MLNKKSIIMKTLTRAITLMRPHNGVGVEVFTQWLEYNVPRHLKGRMFRDACGNLHVDARTEDTNRTLFVAHVDTVHRMDGHNKIVVESTPKGSFIRASTGSCLGADDGAGVAMLMHLMHADVHAYYVFTQGEEVGGIGAKHLAKYNPELLDQFDRAVAFDRRGTDSVITHQGRGRCCSDAFGAALADSLNDGHPYLMMLGDDTGVYTDTAEFVDNIPECTNISVGYYNEHGDREYIDMDFFEVLSIAVLNVRWDELPTERDPKVIEPSKAFDYGAWGVTDDAGPHDWTLHDIRGALEDAREGYFEELFYLIGEEVYPEDPALAVRHLSTKRLTDEVIEKMKDMTHVYDASMVLCTLFDALYQE